MKRMTLLCLLAVLALSALPIAAQDATPNTSQPPSVTVADQVSLDGTVTVASVFSAAPGWIVIHATVDGAMGPAVGIAPVMAGLNENVSVAIDPLGVTSAAIAMLHTDTNEAGVYEFPLVEGADLPVTLDGAVVQASFNLTALRVWDQQVANDTVVIGSIVSPNSGWAVIHADNGGQPGPVLGSWQYQPGTSVAVRVPISVDGRTPVLWAMLHVDDNVVGTYEFDGQSGFDNPVMVNGVMATASFNSTDAPVVITAAGAPLPTTNGALPFISAFNQDATGDGTTSTFVVNGLLSAGPGWVDVHADASHPGKSLGHTQVNDGESTNVSVALSALTTPFPPTTLPPTVWPMLHTDDGQPGVYEYLKVPGLDLPVVVNGAVVTYPVSILAVTPLPTIAPDATVEATMEATIEAIIEATTEATLEATVEATVEATEAPVEMTEAPEATETAAPPPEVTEVPPEATAAA